MPPKSLGKLEQSILSLLEQNPDGCPEPYLKQKLKTDNETRCKAINSLLKANRIELKTQGSTLIYGLKRTAAPGSSTKDLSQEERVVHKLIEDAGNKGIWVKEIRTRSNLQLTQLNKVLKTLESKKVIKSVKLVNDNKKKVYMLYDVQPDSSLTGGAWYSDSDFESEFVDILSRQTLRFLQQQRSHADVEHEDPLLARRQMLCDVKQVKNFISQLGISKVELSPEEVYQILDALVYDGTISKTDILAPDGSSVTCYYALKFPPLTSGLTHIPCNVCPVIKNCSIGGVVSPLSCKYMKEWLEF